MKAVTCLAVILLMSCAAEFVVFAQGPESCEQCICAADANCIALEDCPDEGDLDGCKFVSFTAACNGNYSMRITLICPNEDQCESCMACAVLYDVESGTEIGRCHTGCILNDCTYDCATGATLQSGHDYKFYVCLVTCFGEDVCDKCEGCTARGFLYRTTFSSACNAIPGCNP